MISRQQAKPKPSEFGAISKSRRSERPASIVPLVTPQTQKEPSKYGKDAKTTGLVPSELIFDNIPKDKESRVVLPPL